MRIRGFWDCLTAAVSEFGLSKKEVTRRMGCNRRDENKLRARLGVCEYCNKDSDGYVKPVEKNGHAFIRFGMKGWELSLKANGWHGSAKIRYCPMCGRDLLVK